MTHQLAYLEPGAPFPSTEHALDNPNGLLAVGGALDTATLLEAYSKGIFPWYEPSQPVLWWSPDPRSVLIPNELHISRSLRRCLRRNRYTISLDRDFDAVIRACATTPRGDSTGTWISEEMRAAYQRLHQEGHAHSVEVYRQDRLVGGLYGVQRSAAFFGESMFSRETDASKVALVALCILQRRIGGTLIDCQIESEHLNSLGAKNIGRDRFERLLQQGHPVSSTWSCSSLTPTAAAAQDADAAATDRQRVVTSTLLHSLQELDSSEAIIGD